MGWLAKKFFFRTQEDEKKEDSSVLGPKVYAISGCADHQYSSDGISGSLIATWSMPTAAGKQGGALTNGLLSILEDDRKTGLSFVDILTSVRGSLESVGTGQTPQLSANYKMDLDTPFELVHASGKGDRRALLVGINYVDTPSELNGCHADVKRMASYLQEHHDFRDGEIKILCDDGESMPPTRNYILYMLSHLVRISKPGDSLFFMFSGHGTRVKDYSGDEADGYDEALCPLDSDSEWNMITDDLLYQILVMGAAEDVHIVCLFDCCHSGTILDLPYVFQADGSSKEMVFQDGFSGEA